MEGRRGAFFVIQKFQVIQSRLRRGIFFFIYNRQVPRLS